MVRDKTKSDEPAQPVKPHVFDDAELAQLSMAHGRRSSIPEPERRRLADERKQQIGSTLNAARNGNQRVDQDIIEQYQYELKMILAGHWEPKMLKPKGEAAQILEAAMGTPGTPLSPQAITQENHVDAILES